MRNLIISSAALFALAGCNTVGGFGQDLQTLGNALTNASDDAVEGNAKQSASADDRDLCGGAGASRRRGC